MGTFFSSPRADFNILYHGNNHPAKYNHLSPENKLLLFRSLSLTPSIRGMQYLPADFEEFKLDTTDHTGKIVVMVDPLSTGFCVSKRLDKYGVKQILVWSDF